jgi:hypothetical protein
MAVLGRPTDYTQEIADQICEQLADGMSLREICKADDMPNRSTVFRWCALIPEFSIQYARAREEQAEALADEIIAIADEKTGDVRVDSEGREQPDHEFIARSKLRVDARKWVASKLKPRKYGEKIQQEHTSPDGSMTPKALDMTKLPREALKAIVEAADTQFNED